LESIVLSKRYAQSRAFTSLTPHTSNANRLMASMLRRDSIELSLVRLNRAQIRPFTGPVGRSGG
jgi:hypothetical protein